MTLGFPHKQGMYDPHFEHEACGIGFLAQLHGKKSNHIVKNALKMLLNLDHRGGQGDEANTGDGAGILLQIPHDFFVKVFHSDHIELPAPGEYGVGMVFLPQRDRLRQTCEEKINQIIAEEGQSLIGWRTVPVENESLGQRAVTAQPCIRQVFISKSELSISELDFERKLYVIRKRVEIEVESSVKEEDSLYFASLSARTIVYKGMLTTEQLDKFYVDLQDKAIKTAMALVHSRFSTNTFPSWERAHPNRYIIHNGEINTLKGNVHWMKAREKMCASGVFGEDLQKVIPVIDEDGSDSAMFDNALEFLMLTGRSMAHSAMMMIPEPWAHDEDMDPKKRAFYEYHSTLMEPWDGPAAVAFTNGKQIGACLDRNGLRPARYCVTKDDYIMMSSETGVLDVDPANIKYNERLHPGHILLIDLEEGRIISDKEVKQNIASEQPYQQWLDEHLYEFADMPTDDSRDLPKESNDPLVQRQNAFAYTEEELDTIIKPMAAEGVDPIGSMGYDSPLAVLSRNPQLLYTYFKQMFAQVTNPPIDAIREEIITQISTMIGAEGNLLDPKAINCRQVRLKTPFLTNEQMYSIRTNTLDGFSNTTFDITFEASKGTGELQQALDEMFSLADEAIKDGITMLILSDRKVNKKRAAIPALLATAGLHHHLIRQGTRTKVAILLESAEPREVHHFSVLLGYGTDAINPYLVYETLVDLVDREKLKDISADEAIENYIKGLTKGVLKVISKMGISTFQSYKGAQIFEAIGIDQSVIDKYFSWTPSRIAGVDVDIIAQEALMRHERAYFTEEGSQSLNKGDDFKYRKNGDEEHMLYPKTISKLQKSSRAGDYEGYKEYSTLIQETQERFTSLRGMLRFKKRDSIPLEEVEPIESITRRFKTGAMSYGAISQEAHETLAIAMNRIGGKSNTGEGGEHPSRYTPDENGDSRRSAIKQVASGRFGVTSHYLTNADEIQIKMAQGAKPGEGGQLPGTKVYPWIAEVRGSTPGVGLISPPPHHDIYSIEDLAELIHDLKNSNPSARITVKLVSEAGVGTVAAGVAKALADLVLISGYDGGTGAAAKTSIKHAGLPWELGLAETHQTLLLNGLRDRIVVETDGRMMTGRDVIVAALLGAEEYGFATTPLVVVGCVMARVCHLDTCPVGVATQNPKLRKRFKGDADHVVNFMTFIARETREIMAELGFKTINEMIGRTDVLEVAQAADHWKAKGIDLSELLYQPEVGAEVGRYATKAQDHGLENSLDMKELLAICQPAIQQKQKVKGISPIRNTNRVVGTIVGHEVTKKYGAEGLPEDTIKLHFIGSAGQSFGAFVPKGMTLSLEGDANDYFGKGLSGGKLTVYPSSKSTFIPEENIVIGNVAFYGATSGEAYIRGRAGERFCVRNSGARVVVEGVGDHGCEYMTGGRVVILGPTGKNFAAGMSGGVAYVLDDKGSFQEMCNKTMVSCENLSDQQEIEDVKSLIEQHVKYTNSDHAQKILDHWGMVIHQFVKIIPQDYKRMLETIEDVRDTGVDGEEAVMAAFEKNRSDISRVGGN